jgi:hypothetical protein
VFGDTEEDDCLEEYTIESVLADSSMTTSLKLSMETTPFNNNNNNNKIIKII